MHLRGEGHGDVGVHLERTGWSVLCARMRMGRRRKMKRVGGMADCGVGYAGEMREHNVGLQFRVLYISCKGGWSWLS